MPKKTQLLDTAERRREVIQLRESGATWEAIADAMRERHGVDALPNHWDRRYACQDFHRELDKVQEETKKSARTVREVELRRLDRMQRGLWAKATAGDDKAVHAALRVMERRARLLGLDEPERFEQAVSMVDSEDYQALRSTLMGALEDFPEARAALADLFTADGPEDA